MDIDKVKKLEFAKKELKKSFVGLDDIIDDIIKSISPWYLTPEVINRPTVVSLWGMTGTGKSSVVKRLIELLGLTDKSITFDCGRESEGNTYGDSLMDKISEVFGSTDDESTSGCSKGKDIIFIFDEFQYARTINEEGCEVIKAPLRPIWNIIDDGVVSTYESRYNINRFREFLFECEILAEELLGHDVKLSNGKIFDLEDKKLVAQTTTGMFLLKNLGGNLVSYSESETSDEVENDLNKKDIDLFEIIGSYALKVIIKKLNSHTPSKGDEILKSLTNSKSFFEFLNIIKNVIGSILAPTVFDCSKSLVFVVGNLDEAFNVQSNLDHDGDADTFNEITKSVTVVDIKTSLKKRFRAEQISRLGNNLIKYPTLRTSDFKEIINREVNRIINDFRKISDLKISIDDSVKKLLYSEGVCPTQGVRPVFTTINTILTPIFSELIVNRGEADQCRLSTVNDNYNTAKSTIVCEFSKDSTIINKFEYPIKLQLGELRDPNNRKTRYATAVHEAGHAMIMYYMTGKLPIKIISVDTSSGGCCYTFNKDRHAEIPCKRDYTNSIMISMGGYLAEQVIFDDSEQCLLGSGNDIEEAWDLIKDGVLNLGYFVPFRFTDHDTKTGDGDPGGLNIKDFKLAVDNNTSISIYNIIEDMLINFKDRVINILSNDKKLLSQVALSLGETGSMTGEEFKKYVDNYASEEFKLAIKASKEELDYDWYKKKLLNIINE